MKNKPSRTDWAKLNETTDDTIDTSDSPELSDDFFEKATLRLPEPVSVALDINPAPRVYADFHSADVNGNLRLNCVGTVEDLSEQRITLKEGLVLMLYSENLEAEGHVHFSADENIWVAVIDWNAIRETSLGEPKDSFTPLPKSA